MLKSNKKLIMLTALVSSVALSGCASNDELIEQQDQQAEQISSLQSDLQAQQEATQQLSFKVDQIVTDQDEMKQKMAESNNVYVIKENDTLYSIAQEIGISVDELLQLNPDIKNPKSLLIGQKINIVE